MTATPWPHWRPGMRILTARALLVYEVRRHVDGYLLLGCVMTSPDVAGQTIDVDGRNPLAQPDLDDDGTLGHLKGMVRDRRGESFYSAFYVLELDEEFKIDDDGASPGWFEPVTARTYATEGEAYKAALDALEVTP